jgi:hypothetical protein
VVVQGVMLAGSCALPDPEASDTELISTDRPSFRDGTGLLPAERVQIESGATDRIDDEAGVQTVR